MSYVGSEQWNTYKDVPPGTVLYQPVAFMEDLGYELRANDAYTSCEEAEGHWWAQRHAKFRVEETTIDRFLLEKVLDPGCTLAGIMAPGHILDWKRGWKQGQPTSGKENQ